MSEGPRVEISSRQQWRDWLAGNASSSTGVWVVTWKKGSSHPHVPCDDLVDEAIAVGWVDSRPQRVDEERSALLVTPRSPRSRWSKKNKARVSALLSAGLMRTEGLTDVEELREPPDLAAALDAVPEARAHDDAFPRSTRRALLEWVSAAKTERTRSTRVERTVADAALGIRANQWRQPTSATGPSTDRSASTRDRP